MNEEILEYAIKKTCELLAIDSPTGYTGNAERFVLQTFSEELGFPTTHTVKGGVLIDFGGPASDEGALLLAAHADTLGAMVCEIKSDGRMRVTKLGGLNANNVEAENCRVITKFSGEYEGTLQLANASIHVNPEYDKTERTFDSIELVLDETVYTKEDVKDLGIDVGDIVCVDPRTRITASGYIKSRFLDDKLSVGILMGLGKAIRDGLVKPTRRLYGYVTVYEEVGHGASGSIPQDVREVISVDMGCIGEGLQCTEQQVSICAKDTFGPYAYETTKALIEAAKRAEVDYAVDVYPRYGSDVEDALTSGYDIRHGLIGPGVYASHGYERSHKDGVMNTLKLLEAYISR